MQIAVACIKVASQAVGTMPTILVFPILPFIMTVCLVIYWVMVSGYLYSAGTIEPRYTSSSTTQSYSLAVSAPDTLHEHIQVGGTACLWWLHWKEALLYNST